MTFALTIRTHEELLADARRDLRFRIAAAIDSEIDQRARLLGYGSAAQLASYAASTVPDWAAEAQIFVAWRDAVWMKAIQMQEGATDLRNFPSSEGVLAALPKWPGAQGLQPG